MTNIAGYHCLKAYLQWKNNITKILKIDAILVFLKDADDYRRLYLLFDISHNLSDDRTLTLSLRSTSDQIHVKEFRDNLNAIGFQIQEVQKR